ncbi:MAG: glycoside hydrolase [Armatimonadetes bacterium]|nr:glycoside hydrolase [Armatimonadota bacterium]
MPTRRPASVAFLWHLHQPWYADPRSGRMILPWTRLHALKDYLDMSAVLDGHPGVRVTFNLVPSLLAQLRLYADGQAVDSLLELARVPAAELTLDQRIRLLGEGFRCHWPRMLEPFARYRELLARRGADPAEGAARWTDAELRDLQVWAHLAWCGTWLRRTDPVVGSLLRKARGFTEDDRECLLAALDTALASVLPRYAAAAREGRIELATSPYYHPILPLLCRYEDARVAMPGVRLPPGAEAIPEDAATQLRRGRALCAELLGREPVGLWPSEGSVSDAALALAEAAGFQWAATDEQILFRSLRPASPSAFAQPYRHGSLALFFRHQRASDKIGFDYAGWDAPHAVADLIGLLERAAQASDQPHPVVSVILDGENCWETYKENGWEFLDRLYGELARHPWLRPVTFSEHLAETPPAAELPHVFPGSWINHDFYVWAGHREDQRAWELLFRTRRALVAGQARLADEDRAAAWEHLYIAEGSDWYWWYGDDRNSGDDATWDRLFRDRLRAVYEALGQTPPAELDEPIAGLAAPSPVSLPVAPFTPVLDGRETGFFEWRAAGRLEGRGAAGAMTRDLETVLRQVRYGFDDTDAHLALELDPSAGDGDLRVRLEWRHADGQATLELDLGAAARPRRGSLAGTAAGEARVAVGKLIELSLPRDALPAAAGQSVDLTVMVYRGAELVDRWPARGAFDLPLPDERDWLREWMV